MLNWLKGLLASFRERRAARAAAQERLIEKRRKSRACARRRRERTTALILAQARQIMRNTFVIADLETTGFSARDQILEIAGIRVNHRGEVLDELRMLIRIRGRVPDHIRALTGITDAMLVRRGLELRDAFEKFAEFCGDHPVFCHNAGFDRRFLKAAGERLKISFENEVHCSMKVARAAWPKLRSHKLDHLARLTGAPKPTHRALDDVRTTLGVLQAAVDFEPDTLEMAA